MDIQAHVDLFKLNDPRVAALSIGRMSTTALSRSIMPGDAILLIGSRLYALSQLEYYALAKLRLPRSLDQGTVSKLLTGAYDAQLPPAVVIRLREISRTSAACTKCQYNAYKQEIAGLIREHIDAIPDIVKKDIPMSLDVPPYPGASGPIANTVSGLFPKLFGAFEYKRKPCFDCVEKHVSQAYITGTESEMGYPEHLALCEGHLREAYEECPEDIVELRELLLFCIAKTKHDLKPFVPAMNILYLLGVYRNSASISAAAEPNQPMPDMALQLTEEQEKELGALSSPVKIHLLRACLKPLNTLQQQTKQELIRIKWQGQMAQLAEAFLPYSTSVAGMLRNRRLLFRVQPTLAGPPYDCSDIIKALKGQPCGSSQEQSGNLPVL